MLWCLIVPAILAALLALVALVAPVPRIERAHPERLLRGCIATAFLLVAAGLAGLAIVLQEVLL